MVPSASSCKRGDARSGHLPRNSFTGTPPVSALLWLRSTDHLSPPPQPRPRLPIAASAGNGRRGNATPPTLSRVPVTPSPYRRYLQSPRPRLPMAASAGDGRRGNATPPALSRVSVTPSPHRRYRQSPRSRLPIAASADRDTPTGTLHSHTPLLALAPAFTTTNSSAHSRSHA